MLSRNDIEKLLRSNVGNGPYNIMGYFLARIYLFPIDINCSITYDFRNTHFKQSKKQVIRSVPKSGFEISSLKYYFEADESHDLSR